MADISDDDKRLDFLWKVHEYTNEYIRFADPKARWVAAFAAALIGVLYAAKVQDAWTSAVFQNAGKGAIAKAIVAAAAFALLGVSVILSAWSMIPRLWARYAAGTVARVAVNQESKNKAVRQGFLFFEEVIKYADESAYFDAIQNAKPPEFNRVVAKHVYALAGVASHKHRWATCAFYVLLPATICGIVALLWPV
jgi:hypothetical protein